MESIRENPLVVRVRYEDPVFPKTKRPQKEVVQNSQLNIILDILLKIRSLRYDAMGLDIANVWMKNRWKCYISEMVEQL